MTINQMSQVLQSIGACFAITTAKCVLPNDPYGSKPSYHIHPDAKYPHQLRIVRVFSQKQFLDWVRTVKAVDRCTDQTAAEDLWIAYNNRWD